MTTARQRSKTGIPPLQNGDRLTRAEFERRYNAMPQADHIQLIEGVVYMPSPVRTKKHGKPHAILCTWIGYYVSKTPGIEVIADNVTVRLDEDNEPQPDLLLLLPESLGGQAVVDEDDYVSGPPDLICEISSSTVSIDMHAKMNAYRRNGVREYLVWRVEEESVDWFELIDGRYEEKPLEDDLFKSKWFPGLWLDPAALLDQDLPKLFAAVDRGVADASHAEFVGRLPSH